MRTTRSTQAPALRCRAQRVWVLALVSQACAVDLQVPAGSLVSCADDAECASGLVCHAVLSRCVEATAGAEPPAIVESSVVLDPLRARATIEVTLDFAVTRPLLLTPAVVLDTPGGAVFAVSETAPQHYRATLVTDRSLPEGTWPILASLTDVSGALAADLTVTTLDLDFTAPALSSPVVAAPRLLGATGPNASTQLSFSLTEDLPDPPDVAVVWPGTNEPPRAAAFSSSDPSTRSYVFVYTSAGTEPEGAASVQVSSSDAAGNLGVGSTADVVVFDITGPTVVDGTVIVQYIPAEINVLSDVGAATFGTTLRLSFLFAEPVFFDPATSEVGPLVSAVESPSLVFSRVAAAGSSFVFEHTLEAGGDYNDGPQTLLVQASDLVGNPGSSFVALGEHPLVDTTAPDPPDVSTSASAQGIVYRRIPWGSVETSQGAATFTLRGGAGRAEPLAWVIAYDQPIADALGEIGRGRADEAGAFANLGLSRADRRDVFVTAADAAGNQSTALRVRNVEWIATLGDKQAGSTLENPMSFAAVPYWLPTLEQPSEEEANGVDGPDQPGGAIFQSGAAALWRQVSFHPSVDLPPTYNGVVAHDTPSSLIDAFGGTTHLFGGCEIADCSSGAIRGELRRYAWVPSVSRYTWSLTANESAATPRGRFGAAFGFDPVANVLVLFGGQQRPLSSGDVACAGEAGDNLCADAWTYRSGWTNQGTPGPVRRVGASMAYDSARRRMLLFGGYTTASCTNPSCYLNDLWARSSATGVWSAVAATGSPPAGRRDASVAYDSLRDRLIVFGGQVQRPNTSVACPPGSAAPSGLTCVYNDTWAFDGTSWLAIAAGTPPMARFQAPAVFDAGLGAVGFYGGNSGLLAVCEGTVSPVCRLPHFLGADGWFTPVQVGAVPPGRTGHGMAYEGLRNTTVIIGGRNPPSGQDTPSEARHFNSGAVARPAQVLRAPLAAAVPAIVIAKVNFQDGSVPAPAGYLADVGLPFADRGNGFSYGWDLDATSAARVRADPSSPDLRYDTLNHLWRGASESYIWEIALPNGEYSVRVVGGDPTFIDGTLRTLVEGVRVLEHVQTELQPWNEGTAVVTLTDGRLTIENDPTNLDFNKICFVEIYEVNETPERLSFRWRGGSEARTYHPQQRIVLHNNAAGTNLAATYDTTGVLSPLLGRDPRGLWAVNLRDSVAASSPSLDQWCIDIVGDSGGPRCRSTPISISNGSATWDVMSLHDLTVSSVAGASVSVSVTHPVMAQVDLELVVMPVSSAPANDVELFVWQTGGWTEKTAGSAAVGDLFDLVWSTDDPAELRGLFSGAQRVFNGAVTTTHANGSLQGGNILRTDYVELQIDYRLP